MVGAPPTPSPSLEMLLQIEGCGLCADLVTLLAVSRPHCGCDPCWLRASPPPPPAGRLASSALAELSRHCPSPSWSQAFQDLPPPCPVPHPLTSQWAGCTSPNCGFTSPAAASVWEARDPRRRREPHFFIHLSLSLTAQHCTFHHATRV